jgi:hypothetical protein
MMNIIGREYAKGDDTMSVRNRTVASKWKKHVVLLQDSSIRDFLPATEPFNRKTLRKYVKKYSIVFVKPTFGTGGHGIMRIAKKNKKYLLQSGVKKKGFRHKEELIRTVNKKVKKNTYIVQQGIDLLSIHKRPVDFRVLMVKPYEEWEYMGVIGKQAARKKMVTNHCQGGKPIMIHRALRKGRGLSREQTKEMKKRLKKASRSICQILNKKFPHLRELGLDFGIDNNERIWLLEANTKPMFRLFRHHRDKSLYPKIYKYVKRIRTLP